MNLNKKISLRILAVMKLDKITRYKLSKSIKVDKHKLDNYLQGKAKWDINFIINICRQLSLNINWVIKGEGSTYSYSDNEFYKLKRWATPLLPRCFNVADWSDFRILADRIGIPRIKGMFLKIIKEDSSTKISTVEKSR